MTTMREEIRHLIDRVEAFEIDPSEKVLGFAERLARENRWSLSYSQRVIREYKRFCVLALASGHRVTPSEAVDQAWHLHLTYTRSYWERFCRETLRRPLHHEPTAGGSSEDIKFHDWYTETLSSYERLFNETPPRDVWPSPKKRFRHSGRWAWINLGHYWLVPRTFVWPMVVVSLSLLLMILPGCAAALAFPERPDWLPPILTGGIFPFTLHGDGFLIFYGALCISGLVAVIFLRSLPKPNENHLSTDRSHDLNVDELAVLSGGGSRLAHVSLTRLYTKQLIEVKKNSWLYSRKLIARPTTEPPASPIDRDLYAEIINGKPTRQLLKVIQPHYERINNKLVSLHLRDDSAFHSNAANVIIAAISIMGLMRLIQGSWVGEEIGFLFVMTILFPIVAVLINGSRKKVTAAGAAYIENSKQKMTSDWPAPVTKLTPQCNQDQLLMNVALLGISTVAGVEGFGPFVPVLQNMSTHSGSGGCGGGCGAGCGSGCGGGGCGGCGGCGG